MEGKEGMTDMRIGDGVLELSMKMGDGVLELSRKTNRGEFLGDDG